MSRAAMLETRQLRYFVAVAEELSFRRAAERLHITSPPLSQVIKQLEAELNVTLFQRNTHGVQLTRAGEVFLNEARQLLAAAQHSMRLARQAEAGEAGALRIGFSASAIFSTTLTAALAMLLEQRPRLELQLVEGNAQEHLQALLAGRLDAALLRADIQESDGLRLYPLGDEPLYAVLGGRHPLAGDERLELAQLSRERLLLQPATQRTFLRRQIETLAERAGLSLTHALELPDIASMLCFASAGLGVAVLPKSAALTPHGLVAIPLAEVNASRPLTLVSAAHSAAALALEALMKERDT